VLASKNKSTVDFDVVRFAVGCYFVARNAAVVRSLTGGANIGQFTKVTFAGG
jgi:hypothetical protein